MENTKVSSQLVKHNLKDNLFCIIFRDPEVQLSLYNAFAGSNHTDVTKLRTVTLENALYLGVKNDCAFIMCDQMFMVEQQSTLCGNMPLRHLIYVTEEFKDLVESKKVYYTTRQELNNPRFIVLYNGKEMKESQWEERLSEAYIIDEVEPSLELKVTFYNINEGHNQDIKEKCEMLYNYSRFVDYIHEYENQNYVIKEATEMAINRCIEENILRNELERERGRIMSSILTQDITLEEVRLSEAMEDSYERGVLSGESRGEARGIYLLIMNLCNMGVTMEESIQRAAVGFDKSILEVQEIIDEFKNV